MSFDVQDWCDLLGGRGTLSLMKVDMCTEHMYFASAAVSTSI